MVEYKRFSDPRLNRLAYEHQLLDEFCEQSDLVDYEPVIFRKGVPPEKYHIHYKVRTITAIDAHRNPIYGELHTAEIKISPQFPLGGQPSCKMTTPVWHPNIKYSGEFAGRICINAEALGHWHTLDMLAERIGEMLQYKNYHALNIHPHPEDAAVAQWVREYAEPNDIVNKKKKIFTDDRLLLNPNPDWLASREKKIQITILGVRKKEESPEPDTDHQKYYEIASKRKQITIKKR